MMRNININEPVWYNRRTTSERVNLLEKKPRARGTIFLRTSYLVPLVSAGLYLTRSVAGYRRHAVAKLCFKLKLYAVPFRGSRRAVILAKCLAQDLPLYKSWTGRWRGASTCEMSDGYSKIFIFCLLDFANILRL